MKQIEGPDRSLGRGPTLQSEATEVLCPMTATKTIFHLSQGFATTTASPASFCPNSTSSSAFRSLQDATSLARTTQSIPLQPRYSTTLLSFYMVLF